MAWRRRRRRIVTWISGTLRRYMRGFMYLVFGIAIVTGVTYLVGLAPGVELTLVDGTVVISTTTILQFIMFAFGIVFVIRGIRFFIRNF